MSEHITPPEQAVQRDAIDVNDFVYAATGARVRRLTMTDGTHWFPAVDVATDLGYANTRDALAKHVAQDHTTSLGDLAATVAQSDASRRITGHGLKKSMKMVNLQGLVQLVSACTKPEAEPFKQWVAEVIVAVQRDGSYKLERAPIAPAGQQRPLLLPEPLADVIVRLEERNLRLDEEFAAAQREAQDTRRESVRIQDRMLQAMERIAGALDNMAATSRRPQAYAPEAEPPRLTAESVLADWRTRMSVTEDVWAVAIVIAPVLAERGEIRMPLESIADRTGLTMHRVNECLRFMRKHACIRSLGGTPEGAPVYVLNRP
jgi:prophage antirepressor-like protein